MKAETAKAVTAGRKGTNKKAKTAKVVTAGRKGTNKSSDTGNISISYPYSVAKAEAYLSAVLRMEDMGGNLSAVLRMEEKIGKRSVAELNQIKYFLLDYDYAQEKWIPKEAIRSQDELLQQLRRMGDWLNYGETFDNALQIIQNGTAAVVSALEVLNSGKVDPDCLMGLLHTGLAVFETPYFLERGFYGGSRDCFNEPWAAFDDSWDRLLSALKVKCRSMAGRLEALRIDLDRFINDCESNHWHGCDKDQQISERSVAREKALSLTRDAAAVLCQTIFKKPCSRSKKQYADELEMIGPKARGDICKKYLEYSDGAKRGKPIEEFYKEHKEDTFKNMGQDVTLGNLIGGDLDKLRVIIKLGRQNTRRNAKRQHK